MQIEHDHIGSGEAGSRQGREKEFIDHSIAGHPNRTAGSLMSRNNQTSAMPLCGDRYLPTIKQIPTDATCRMCELLIGGRSHAPLSLRWGRNSGSFFRALKTKPLPGAIPPRVAHSHTNHTMGLESSSTT